MPSSKRSLKVENPGQRVDLFVGEALSLSRAKLKALFESGAVRVDGRRAKKGQLVEAGQTVEVEVPEEQPRAAVADTQLELRVLREEPELVFIDKPSGVPSHPLKPGETGSVANALVARYPECAEASEDSREGGLCHRLDVETSGVLLAARTRARWQAMREAFGGDSVDKRYLALVTGPLGDEGEIELPLRHHPRGDRVEPAVDGEDARPAHSSFRVLARSGEFSLVDVRIHTGVLHQVRAHLAAIGAPIVGDALYGGRPLEGLGRFFLHARALTVPGSPRVESPLPAELAAVLEKLAIPPSP